MLSRWCELWLLRCNNIYHTEQNKMAFGRLNSVTSFINPRHIPPVSKSMELLSQELDQSQFRYYYYDQIINLKTFIMLIYLIVDGSRTFNYGIQFYTKSWAPSFTFIQSVARVGANEHSFDWRSSRCNETFQVKKSGRENSHMNSKPSIMY